MHVRGRKPPSVAGFTVLTVRETKGTAKLQKEHPVGHYRDNDNGRHSQKMTTYRQYMTLPARCPAELI